MLVTRFTGPGKSIACNCQIELGRQLRTWRNCVPARLGPDGGWLIFCRNLYHVEAKKAYTACKNYSKYSLVSLPIKSSQTTLSQTTSPPPLKKHDASFAGVCLRHSLARSWAYHVSNSTGEREIVPKWMRTGQFKHYHDNNKIPP